MDDQAVVVGTQDGEGAAVPRRTRRVPAGRDVLIAVAGLVLDVMTFSAILSVPPAAGALILGYAVLGHAATAWRSVAPVVVFAVLWVHSVLAVVLVPGYGPVVGLLIALFTVAARTRFRTGVIALASTSVPGALQVRAEIAMTPEATVSAVVVTAALLLAMIDVAVWGAGRWSRLQRDHALLLERQREHFAREAVTRERTRIARDLHDIISHSVSVMSLQAAGAQSLLPDHPGRVGQALQDIRASGTHAMVELRRLLVVLRAEDDDGDAPATATHGGIADLDDVLRGIRAAGIPARLRTHGVPRELDAGADLTVYRTVQEALTNVASHAGPGVDTDVDLTWREDSIVVSVRNVAPTRPPAAEPGRRGGRGLIGMRERVAATGGTLSTGPAADGGFHLTATIPLPPPTSPAGGA